MSVSSRVANERGWTLGTICGYQIGLDRKYICQDTRISYVTTGVLLQKLIAKDDINRYTHIIVDEVHERDLDIDFCLLVLKMLLKGNANIKVILMSATIDCAKFSKYFSNNQKLNNNAPVYNITGATYQVKEYYIEDLYELGLNKNFGFESKNFPEYNYDEPKIFTESLNMVIELLKHFDEIEKNQIKTNPTKNLRVIQDFPELRGSVLIFVPGMAQIQQLEELIRQRLPNSSLYILPLHSDIVIDQQKRVFEAPQSTRRKVIISTRIAESSITVADVKYVIDFCLTKELWCDPFTNYTHLRMEWTSISSMNQRKGRAGRVSDGACYRLITRKFFNKFDDQPIPQILREPLTKLVLNVKRLKLKNKDPKRFLAFAIQPPNLDDIDRTVLVLKEVGALTLHPNATDGELTYVGNIMAYLPIDIKLSKLILLGHTFGKLRECIIIAAALSTKPFFVRYFKSNLEAFTSQWFWAQGSFCDCLTILNAYNLWEDYQAKGKFAKREDMERWAKSNMIDLYRIREVRELKNEIERRLKDLKIVCNRSVNERRRIYERAAFRSGDDYDIDDENDVERNNFIIKIIIAGAFYPNFFQSTINDEHEVSRMVSGKDYRKTVMIKNLPMKQGVLYHYALLEMFKICSKQIQIHYEDSKAYLEFKMESQVAKTNINFGVYMAVQMRQLRIPLELNRLNDKIAFEMINNLNNARKQLEIDSTLHTKRQEENIVYRLANNYYDEDEENNEDDDLCKSRLSMASSSRQLNSFLVTPTANKLIEKLSDPEYLLKKLRQFPIIITEIIECGNFWAQINENSYKQTLLHIQKTINEKGKLTCVSRISLYVGMLVISPYTDETDATFLYRAKILDLDKDQQLAQVIFVDYGNKEMKKFSQLYSISDEMESIPFQAIQCKLINIEINKLKCPNGVWTKAANDYFMNLINERELQASVYSIVDNVVRIHLSEKENGQNQPLKINEELIKSGFALSITESQVSQNKNSILTAKKKELDRNNNIHQLNDSMMSLDFLKDDEIMVRDSKKIYDSNDESKYEGKIKISGPYSPLEVTYHPIINIGKSKSVRIERDSINFVTLDDEPHNELERMLVASQVTLNHNGLYILWQLKY